MPTFWPARKPGTWSPTRPHTYVGWNRPVTPPHIAQPMPDNESARSGSAAPSSTRTKPIHEPLPVSSTKNSALISSSDLKLRLDTAVPAPWMSSAPGVESTVTLPPALWASHSIGVPKLAVGSFYYSMITHVRGWMCMYTPYTPYIRTQAMSLQICIIGSFYYSMMMHVRGCMYMYTPYIRTQATSLQICIIIGFFYYNIMMHVRGCMYMYVYMTYILPSYARIYPRILSFYTCWV